MGVGLSPIKSERAFEEAGRFLGCVRGEGIQRGVEVTVGQFQDATDRQEIHTTIGTLEGVRGEIRSRAYGTVQGLASLSTAVPDLFGGAYRGHSANAITEIQMI
jgi:hypothetical protein